jgi:hypothetical protein
MKYGAHGLPLIGSGDWNDGMNRVGHEGRGESVWLGWFLVTVLNDFAPICERRGRSDLAERYRNEARWLNGMLELAWDGGWYRRAYFDDGTPLGSVQNDECRLDSLTQSWAVLSQAAETAARAERAMDAVQAHLVRRDARIVLLLTPPFDRMAHDPGYIKGYLPGVRENGGQYTHAALWTVLALAQLGTRRRRDGAVPHDQPDQPHAHAGGPRALPGRAVRRCGRRLRSPDARRPRGLDLVHGVGRLDVSCGARGASRAAPRGRHVQPRPVHPGDVAGLRDRLARRADPLSHYRHEPGAPLPRHRIGHPRWPSVRLAGDSPPRRRGHARRGGGARAVGLGTGAARTRARREP